jgi:hypothetical protein
MAFRATRKNKNRSDIAVVQLLPDGDSEDNILLEACLEYRVFIKVD